MGFPPLIIVGSSGGNQLALSAGDGSILWQQPAPHFGQGSALAQVDNVVVSCSRDGFLSARRIVDGSLVWEYQAFPRSLRTRLPMQGRIGTSGGLVFVQYGEHLSAVDAQDGRPVWSYTSHGVQFALACVGVSSVYLVEMLGHALSRDELRALSAEPRTLERARRAAPKKIMRVLAVQDSTPRWVTEEHAATIPFSEGASSVLEQNGIVYAIGQHSLCAFEAATGALRWVQSEVRPYSQHSLLPADSPELFSVQLNAKGALAAGTSELFVLGGRQIYAVRMDTGETLWSADGDEPGAPAGKFEGLAAADERVYVGHSLTQPQGFQLQVLAGATGALQLAWPEDASLLHADLAWRFQVMRGIVYLPSASELYAIRSTTGEQAWKAPLQNGLTAFLPVYP